MGSDFLWTRHGSPLCPPPILGHNAHQRMEIDSGCGETQVMAFLSQRIRFFRGLYPQVQFCIYSADAEDVKKRLEKWLMNTGLMTGPSRWTIGRYAFLHLLQKDQRGVLVPEGSALVQKEPVTPHDLLGGPRPWAGEGRCVANWPTGLGRAMDTLSGRHLHLILNAANMVKNGVGAALCFYLEDISDALQFIPLSPKLETGTVPAWKKGTPKNLFACCGAVLPIYPKYKLSIFLK